MRVGTSDEIIVSSMRAVYAYNRDDGEVLWKVGGNLVDVIPTPVVGHGFVSPRAAARDLLWRFVRRIGAT